ncbi:PAS domain-containing protein [Candidatus Aerophobetes bacterium]|uniref:histidine kinase n=1 Tax=Aerophobetes bacterium TaxID=2030807 RepID=A0A523QI27_UNCAE|nr:MAG: PAS domain-containing protein [Candidatus Aerophobetes bacterium]
MGKHLYKVILDVLPQAVLVLNQRLRVAMCNRGCESLLSKSMEEIEGEELSEVIPHKDLQNQARVVLQNREVGTKLVELHLDMEKESSKILKATISALDMEDAESLLCLITLEDITQQVQLEEQLVQSEKLAGMGLLARSIAHEVGNPLSIMNSTLQYMQGTLLDHGNENLREAIETIMDNIHQMHTLLRSLSDFTGSKRPQFESCNLQRILAQLLTFISGEAEVHNISIHREFDEDVPNCEIDSREIKQLFLNLFKNAIEAMPQGGKLRVRMHLVRKDSATNEERVLVEISDTGMGISRTEIQYVFRPFYSTKPKGTGLGLAFCRRVVEEHGGEISLKSQVRRGTTFMVTLPIRQGKEGQA